MKIKSIIPFILLIALICTGMLLYKQHDKNAIIHETMNTAIAYSNHQPENPIISDTTGKDTAQSKYDYVGALAHSFSRVEIKGKYGLIDKQGHVVIPVQYNTVFYVNEGMVAVEQNKKYGFYDTKGNMAIPLVYDFASSFNEGYAPVRLGDKWGYINKNGKVVIPIKYEKAWSFDGGMGAVKLNGKWGYINKSGAFVIPLQYDAITYDFKNDTAQVENNGIEFMINRRGKRIWK